MGYMIQDEQDFYCRFIVTLETEELLQIGYLKEHGSVLLQWLKALKKKRIHGFNYPEKYFRLAISFSPPDGTLDPGQVSKELIQ